MERTAYTRVYASITGVVLVLLGLFGFLENSEFNRPELTSELFGFFTVNGWANGFHVVAGLIALLMARRASRLYALLAAIVFLGLGIWGIAAADGELLLGGLPAERAVNLLGLTEHASQFYDGTLAGRGARKQNAPWTRTWMLGTWCRCSPPAMGSM